MATKAQERAKQDAFNRLMIEIELLIEHKLLRKLFIRRIIEYYKEKLRNEDLEV